MKDILTPPKNGQLMVVSCHMAVDYEMRILFDKMITSQLTKDDKLVIFFQTDGGTCSQVHPIRQIIKYLDDLTNLHIINAGLVASAGVPIFLAAKNRYAQDGTTFMLHKARLAVGDRSLTSEELTVSLKDFELEEKDIDRIEAEGVNLTKREKVLYNGGHDVVLTKKQARRAKLINRRIT